MEKKLPPPFSNFNLTG